MHANCGPFILGNQLTELDIRVYATVVRFDMVYVQHFKCNLGTIRHDYPVLNTWLRHLCWAIPGFEESTDSRHIKDDVRSNPHFYIAPNRTFNLFEARVCSFTQNASYICDSTEDSPSHGWTLPIIISLILFPIHVYKETCQAKKKKNGPAHEIMLT